MNLLESEEERAGPDDEEQGQVEDSLLPGHHHSAVAAESVFPRKLLPFSHLSRDHHRRHGESFSGCPSAVVPGSASDDERMGLTNTVQSTGHRKQPRDSLADIKDDGFLLVCGVAVTSFWFLIHYYYYYFQCPVFTAAACHPHAARNTPTISILLPADIQ